MVRILGHSVERVPLRDLNDVIYYKQIKEYSDHEYEISKDLKREITKGRLVKLEQSPSIRAESSGGNGNNGNGTQPQAVTIHQSGVSIEDIKTAVREVLPEMNGKSVGAQDLRGAMMDILPHIMDAVRQEVSSKLSGLSLGTGVAKKTSTYVDPTYIPEIDTSGMVAKIKADEKNVSGSDMESALAALRNMNNK